MKPLTPTTPPIEPAPSTYQETAPTNSSAPVQKPKAHPWLKRSPWLLLGLGLATLTVWALQPKPIRVELGEVTQGDLTVTIDAEGKTRIKNKFVVAAPMSGRLARLHKDVGDTVQTGEVLTTIDPLPLTTQVESAQAKLLELKAQLAGVETQRPKLASLSIAQGNIRSAEALKREMEAKILEAEANLNQSIRDRDRAQRLERDGVIPRQQRENAELLVVQRQQELKVLKQQLNQAIADSHAARETLRVLEAERQDPDYLQEVYRAQIQAVEAELSNLVNEVRKTQIYAPISGKVLRIEQESARFVQAGQTLFELGNPQDLELVIDVLSTDAVQIKPGNFIALEQWGGDEPLVAQVSYIEPSAFTKVSALGVDEQRVNIIGSFLNASVPLGSEYRVDAQISIWEGEDILKVPVSALFRCDQDWCVWQEQNGKAKRQRIQIGRRNDQEAEVKDGLQAKERVVLHPAENLEDGIAIQEHE